KRRRRPRDDEHRRVRDLRDHRRRRAVRQRAEVAARVRRIRRRLADAVPPRPRTTADVVRAIAIRSRLGGRSVLDGVDLAIRRGEVFVIMGPSGCGKTTMLRHLCGLLRPDSGSVYVDGRDLYAMRRDELDALRLRT